MTTRLTDGTTTITFDTESVVAAVSFFPQSGREGETVVDTVRLVVEGVAADVLDLKRSISQLLATARRWYGGPQEDRVYLEYQSEGDSDYWRAAVVDGVAEFSDEPLRHKLDASNDMPAELFVELERESEWEGAETNLTKNSATSWTIINGRSEDIDSVEGELPAPIELRVKNAGSSENWRELWIANMGETGWTDIAHYISSLSTRSWSAGENHSLLLWAEDITSTILDGMAGRYAHVIARFTSLSSNAFLQAGIWAHIGGVYRPAVLGPEMYTGPTGSSSRLVYDLGSFPLPPGGDGSDSGYLALRITVRSATAGSGNLNRLMFFPSSELRRVEQDGFITLENASVVIDDRYRRYYLLNGSEKYSIIRPYAKPLMVIPDRTNRFGVIVRTSTGWGGSSLSLSGTYRPRRLSV